ncbi:MAG TPA: GYD domain-containing protein [Actinomycetes bacterium]|nr:GYD domain-containing protein [Actinomycetes bacterium]
MPKFLFTASYTKEGISGVLREGGSSRAKAIQALADSVNGTIETMYWALGEDDFFLIADIPDTVSAASLAARVAASGSVSIKTTPLLSADDVDAMAAKAQGVDYRPPGA